ncbi:hypothetical protein, partial [Flavobacterium sp. 245]|uniref:hypothetical protein n=1 Tax=Flavobacterium sp. 245 TaxID=2512115 RepID=UPI001AAD2821
RVCRRLSFKNPSRFIGRDFLFYGSLCFLAAKAAKSLFFAINDAFNKSAEAFHGGLRADLCVLCGWTAIKASGSCEKSICCVPQNCVRDGSGILLRYPGHIPHPKTPNRKRYSGQPGPEGNAQIVSIPSTRYRLISVK